MMHAPGFPRPRIRFPSPIVVFRSIFWWTFILTFILTITIMLIAQHSEQGPQQVADTMSTILDGTAFLSHSLINQTQHLCIFIARTYHSPSKGSGGGDEDITQSSLLIRFLDMMRDLIDYMIAIERDMMQQWLHEVEIMRQQQQLQQQQPSVDVYPKKPEHTLRAAIIDHVAAWQTNKPQPPHQQGEPHEYEQPHEQPSSSHSQSQSQSQPHKGEYLASHNPSGHGHDHENGDSESEVDAASLAELEALQPQSQSHQSDSISHGDMSYPDFDSEVYPYTNGDVEPYSQSEINAYLDPLIHSNAYEDPWIGMYANNYTVEVEYMDEEEDDILDT